MNEIDDYLLADEVIDWREDAVLAQARRLRTDNTIETAKRCFEFVRDEIGHCNDIGATLLTCSASEVLREGQGFCCAKSHLLAALLRVNTIPAGFDYQRLSNDDGGYVLHGLNTVWLAGIGWYRIDARGNKPGVDAQFDPPLEQLAWRGDSPGECHYRVNLAKPLPKQPIRQPGRGWRRPDAAGTGLLG